MMLCKVGHFWGSIGFMNCKTEIIWIVLAQFKKSIEFPEKILSDVMIWPQKSKNELLFP